MGILDLLQGAVGAGVQARAAGQQAEMQGMPLLIQLQSALAQRERQSRLDALNERHVNAEIQHLQQPEYTPIEGADGSVTFVDKSNPQLPPGFKKRTTPDPRAVHAANRDYDVKHPLPVQPNNVFLPTQQPDGTTTFTVVPNKGPVTPKNTGLVKPPAGGNSALGQITGARLNIAASQASNADKYMRGYEDELLSGRAKIGATDLMQLKLAMEPDVVKSSAAESWLQAHNPRLAQYFRAGKIVSSAERLVTPRGGSNQLMGLEGMLSTVGPNADAQLIQQVRDYRQGLVSGLTQHATPGQGTLKGRSSGGYSPDNPFAPRP